MKKLIALAFFLVFIVFEAFAQANCALILGGRLLESKTSEAVAFAFVRVRETGATAQSDENGFFQLTVCKGNYTLEISHIECKHFTKKFYIEENIALQIQLEHDQKLLESVTIEAKKIEPLTTQAFSVIKSDKIAEMQGKPLAEVLQSVAGVNVLKTGNNIAKPILQGFSGDRLPILVAGIRQIGQSWGLDHAPEIDPNAFQNIKVLTGANSVRYGNGAIGGVIILEPSDLPDSVGYTGGGQFGTKSNGKGINFNVFFQQKTKNFAFKLQTSGRKMGNQNAPAYFLENTGLSELNFSFQGNYKNFNLFYSHFYTKIGILKSAHIGNVSDLLAAIERGNPIKDGSFSYDIVRPAQRVSHDFLRLAHRQKTGEIGYLFSTAAFQYNFRREYDAHRPFVAVDPQDFSRAEIGFQMPSVSLRSEWEHKKIKNWSGNIGLESNFQQNNTFAGALLPDFRVFDASFFAVERWRKLGKPLEIECGLRYENRHIYVAKNGQKIFQFGGFSNNLGAIYHFWKHSQLRFHIASAWRSPNVSELLSNGVHHGTASFERGNEQLKIEKATNFILGMEVAENKNVAIKFNFYYNRIKNFINLQADTTWNEVLKTRGVVTTIRGAFPAFSYEQTDAILGGGDVNVDWQPFPFLKWHLKAATLLARNARENTWLAMMPSDRLESNLNFYFLQNKQNQSFRNNVFSIHHVFVAKQTRVNRRQLEDGNSTIADFAPAPPAYALTHASAATTFVWKKHSFDLRLQIENIFNIRYRDYLDRLRYFSDATGRNVNFSIRTLF